MAGGDPIASRYAQTLFDSAKAAGELDQTLEQLTLLGRLAQDHPDLRHFLLNPDVEVEDQVQLLDRVLGGAWSGLVKAFTRLLLAFGRGAHLPGVVEAFTALVDEEARRLRVVVRSAHPLTKPLLARLKTSLEHRERSTVELREELAPELIGGVQVLLDHRVIDGSVRRQLDDLRKQLKSIQLR